MCGIVGSIGPNSLNLVEKMNASQVHRGPDSAGVYSDPAQQLTMAMRRLAILDIAGGDQPIVSQDERYAIVYNGEIFNSPELKKDLEAKGESFQSDHSDTEILFKLLIREGKNSLPKLNGMFAFAFYDKQTQTLLLARDRFGIKPLYYSHQGNSFSFASELRSLSQQSGFDHSLDQSALFSYLSLQYVAGEQSIFKSAHRLRQGHLLEYDLSTKSLKIEQWWQPVYQPDLSISKTEWIERIRAGLQEAVMRWSLSDVPLAISLSGGLDSSAIAGICAQNGIKLNAYSLGFGGTGEEAWNELPLARKVAEKWGLPYDETVLQPEAILDKLEDMVAALDEPYGGGLPSWFIYEAMAGKVKVAHSGTGGDEMFGNYGKWSSLENKWIARFKSSRKNTISLEKFRKEFFEKCYYFTDDAKRQILHADFQSVGDTATQLFEQFQASQPPLVRDATASLDINTQLSDEFLLMTDRFSMAHSIEARTPFLDNDFSNLVMQIPVHLRTNRRDLKGLLRQAVTPFLPEELLTAPKKGFVIPLGNWIRTSLRPMVEELLGPDHLKGQGLINPQFYQNYVVPHMSGQIDHTNKLWTVLMFQLWYRRYV